MTPVRIPIENIYYLLCYAWNKFEARDQVPVSVQDATCVLDLLSKILIQATRQLLKRGITQNYTEINDEVAGIKGKLLISESLKQHSFLRNKTACLFDEFSPDTLPNRIVYATLFKLLHTPSLQPSHHRALVQLYRKFPPITRISLQSYHFRQVILQRNDRFYEFILKICQLIHECLLPAEKPGEYLFTDVLRDKHKMALLFEAFVRNFYTLEQKEYQVRRENIRWQFTAKDEHLAYLPLMQTDITLENERRKIIIDTKYYTQTMTVNLSNNEKIYSSNLYQLFSYLLNQENNLPLTQQATGILLYPVCSKEYDDLDFVYGSHRVLIRTVNLNTDWKKIERRLKEIIGNIRS